MFDILELWSLAITGWSLDIRIIYLVT